MRSAETVAISLGLWVYNIFLGLFLVATRNTSSTAILIAVACALSAEKFKLQLEYWWTLLFAFLGYVKNYCCPTKIRATVDGRSAAEQERDQLYAVESNYTISLSDKEEEETATETEGPQSTLFENVRHGSLGDSSVAAPEQPLTDL